ncbi:helix-turn-helix domain-containing protein [Nonomuraea sp. NPDC000554]|uniref:helix-turn-helix domain-containing protein n=1 Tax=Nonomuraea sp. NPDC000554 TaxID=3154259 RepID=UPI003333BFEC
MDKLLNVEEAAELLNTSPRFVRRLIAERRIEFVKLGRPVRIRESALIAYVVEGTVTPMRTADTLPAPRRAA